MSKGLQQAEVQPGSLGRSHHWYRCASFGNCVWYCERCLARKGIITAIVAGFIISVLGGSKVQIGGPTGAFIVIIYGIVTNPEYGVPGLTIATILAGVLLILMGVFKLGTVIKFIPYPIIIGFTAGIALTIFTTQMGDIFGLKQTVLDADGCAVIDEATGHHLMAPLKTPGDFIGKWICYFENIETFNLWNFLVAMLSILLIIFAKGVQEGAWSQQDSWIALRHHLRHIDRACNEVFHGH